ncbi:MAG: hypothetical protein AB7G47_15635 [Mycolicibacterium sp.]|uniref:hypothetical protein n=1 Tax=Mycolicibacterium sp. TaxID=2320850 RepID=UPI003D0ABCD2
MTPGWTKTLLPSAFGVLMVGAAAHRADPPALVVAVAALIAVLMAGWVRTAATLAVVLTLGTVVFADPAPMYTVLAGLAATGFLTLVHSAGRAAATTMLAAAGFAALATVMVVIPLHVPWLPMLAPLAVLAGYLLALSPILFAARR